MKTRPHELPRLPPGRKDAYLVALVLVAGLGELAAVAGAGRLAGAAVVLLLAAGVGLRRRHPVGALALGISGMALAGLLSEEIGEAGGAPFLALIFLVFSMATRVDPPRLHAAVALVLAGGVAFVLLDHHGNDPSDFFLLAALLVAAPVAGGRLLRSRSMLTRTLREKAQRAERGRDRRALEAVEAERTRIAGELHDVVAHALGAMTVQAAAARRLAEKDPDRAAAAFQAVEDTGREALAELRRLLGVLRQADEDLALAPQPRLAFLGELVRRISAAGLRVRLEVEGDIPAALPVGIDRTAYRVVQEALGEALEAGHAGLAEVRVRHRASEIEVEVLDDGRGRDRRLLGMRERVRVYGGQLEISPRRDGGHRVRARLPVEGAA